MNNHYIYSDFSDTIAKPSIGEKFPPFELELGKLVGLDISAQYEHFLSIRRDETVPYEERMQVWLKPFMSLLTQKHINQLALTFIINENFIRAIDILRNKLQTKSLEITIVSGTLWQIIDSFLRREDTRKSLNKSGVTFKIAATKLFFDKNGKFNGELVVTDKLAFSQASSFPDKCLIIGDNAMETYGFGEKLLNAQNFNIKIITERVGKYLNHL